MITRLALLGIVFLLTGCLGDKFTPSEHALVSKERNRICFTVYKPDDYSVSYFDLFKRGYQNSAQQPEVAGYTTSNRLLLCLPEDTFISSETIYIAQFGLKPHAGRKPIRNFAVAFKIYDTGAVSVPLQRNEITYYIGRGY